MGKGEDERKKDRVLLAVSGCTQPLEDLVLFQRSGHKPIGFVLD
jgi:hypothetical protein